MKPEDIDDFLVWAAIGVVLGGRIGYVLFYDSAPLPRQSARDLRRLAGRHVVPWRPARHHARHDPVRPLKRGIRIWSLFDVVAAGVPVGLGLVRIANFINSELWGRPTDVPWAVVFPNGGPVPRHPSQLYEALLEGPGAVPRAAHPHPFAPQAEDAAASSPAPSSPAMALSRIFVEFFREPDQQIGYLFGGWLTMGMVLSLPMVLVGIWAMLSATRRQQAAQPA